MVPGVWYIVYHTLGKITLVEFHSSLVGVEGKKPVELILA